MTGWLRDVVEGTCSRARSSSFCPPASLSSLAATKDDAELDVAELKKLLQRGQKTIHDQPNRGL